MVYGMGAALPHDEVPRLSDEALLTVWIRASEAEVEGFARVDDSIQDDASFLCLVMLTFSSLENGIMMIVLLRQKKYIEVELA